MQNHLAKFWEYELVRTFKRCLVISLAAIGNALDVTVFEICQGLHVALHASQFICGNIRGRIDLLESIYEPRDLRSKFRGFGNRFADNPYGLRIIADKPKFSALTLQYSFHNFCLISIKSFLIVTPDPMKI